MQTVIETKQVINEVNFKPVLKADEISAVAMIGKTLNEYCQYFAEVLTNGDASRGVK